MPMLSFSVKFDELVNGNKKQTIRFPRKKGEIKVGDKLYLWWKSRTPQRKKIGEATCTESVYKKVCELTETDAIKDGFLTLQDLKTTLFMLHPNITEQTKIHIITWNEFMLHPKPFLIANYDGQKIYASTIRELLDLYDQPDNKIDNEDFLKALTGMRHYPRTVNEKNHIDELRRNS